MSKQDDKDSMAEDYLAQIKWRGEHPYRKGRPPEPDWKYKPVYSRIPSASETRLAIILLMVLIAVAGFAIFEFVTTSHVDIVWVFIGIILLGLLFLATRK